MECGFRPHSHGTKHAHTPGGGPRHRVHHGSVTDEECCYRSGGGFTGTGPCASNGGRTDWIGCHRQEPCCPVVETVNDDDNDDDDDETAVSMGAHSALAAASSLNNVEMFSTKPSAFLEEGQKNAEHVLQQAAHHEQQNQQQPVSNNDGTCAVDRRRSAGGKGAGRIIALLPPVRHCVWRTQCCQVKLDRNIYVYIQWLDKNPNRKKFREKACLSSIKKQYEKCNKFFL